MYDLLRWRFLDIADPAWEDVLGVIRRHGSNMYMIENEDWELIGEFMLTDFNGKAAQIHFSLSPGLSWSDGIALCKQTSDEILAKWKDQKGQPYLLSLVGLTPKLNRAACLTVLKAGFKKVAEIPGAIYNANDDEYEDCMLTVKTGGA
jgi:hypothetical protein